MSSLIEQLTQENVQAEITIEGELVVTSVVGKQIVFRTNLDQTKALVAAYQGRIRELERRR